MTDKKDISKAETFNKRAREVAAEKFGLELYAKQDSWTVMECFLAGWDAREATLKEREALIELGCGDNSCYFAKEKGGMRTNGGCRCFSGAGFDRSPLSSAFKMLPEIMLLRTQLAEARERLDKYQVYGTNGCKNCETGRITLYHRGCWCITCQGKTFDHSDLEPSDE